MTTLRQIEIESIFLISVVAAVSLYFVIQKNNQGQFNGSMRIASINSPLAKPDPEQSVFSQISPDGTKEVIMKIARNNDGTQTYSFYTADSSGVNEKYIFTRTLEKEENIVIPYNTWSPNNQYFFIQENAEEGTSIFAFKASGEAFSEEEVYFDVTDLFRKKETGNNFAEATGWASESLIILNTTKQDKTKGPSYWFELPSRAIIQLSTEF